jgi:(E)-4-hydroxy-3-methylbut-2-enyl-diphosphate synthase
VSALNKEKRQITAGGIKIGGGAPVSVQSMCNTDTRNIEATVKQIDELYKAGCDITRAAVSDEEGAAALKEIRRRSKIPIVADIQYDWRLAVMSAKNGADKIRINPGNIGNEQGVREVVAACRDRGLPIRIGVNGGSLERELLAEYGGPVPMALAKSALNHARLLEKLSFYDIVLSVKSSNVKNMIEAYRILHQQCDYPLHLGVTEAGSERMGIIKSAVGIGSLLCDGIGDTIRVSLTDRPVKEVYAGLDILKSVGMGKGGVEIISCPTCARCKIDLIALVKEVEETFASINKPIKVAIMGCAVNGPGEAKEADIGVAGGKGEGLIFSKGEIIKKVPYDAILKALSEEIEKL